MQTLLADRIYSARRMSGLSLQELADRMERVGMPISRQAIHQFEQDRSNPEASTLLALAKALNVRLEYFYRESNLLLEKVEYRKRVKLSKTDEIAIHEKAKDVLERYFEIEDLLDSSMTFVNPIFDFQINSPEDIEKAAELIRERWQLGTDPIPGVMEMLEERGIKVLEISASESFQGLCAYVNNTPIIVVNENDNVVRSRFTALHELAHIVLRFGTGDLDEEKYCHHFAGALLFPAKSVVATFSEKRKKISLAELIQAKAYYGISIQAILARLKILNVIADSVYRGFIIWMTKTGYRKKEPGQYPGEEKARRFSQLLYRAAAEEVISLSKAASLNNQSLTEFRRTLAGIGEVTPS
jgi:Zn-dependent peptidase ImmA (M78 family)/DNA-binding XRE family transcriptional regulator